MLYMAETSYQCKDVRTLCTIKLWYNFTKKQKPIKNNIIKTVQLIRFKGDAGAC